MSHPLQSFVLDLVHLLLGQTGDVDRQPAVDLVTAFCDDPAREGVWTGLDKGTYCERLGELVRDPHKLNQASTSFCASAAVLYLFARDYPSRFADYGIRLFETGQTHIGSRTIKMTPEIRTTDLKEWIVSQNWQVDATDLLLMLGIIEDMTLLSIKGPDSYALKPPFWDTAYATDIQSTMGKSGLYEVKKLDATAGAITAATTPPRAALVVVGSMGLFSEKEGLMAGRHAAVLIPPTMIEGGNITYRFWSWGVFTNQNTFPLDGDRYRAHTTSVSSFDANIDAVIQVTPTGEDY